jgi:hypothetical protein
MHHRRLVGIDLGIISAHTVRVLDGDGSVVCRRKAVPTVASLGEVEQAALAGVAPGTRLEVVLEPTGPAWLPIAVFCTNRGHTVSRVSSGLVRMIFVGCYRGRPRQAASTPTPWHGRALVGPAGLHPLQLPGAERAALDRRVRPATGSPAGRPAQAPQQGPGPPTAATSPLTGDLGMADPAVLERFGADPTRCFPPAGRGLPG